MHLHTYRNMVWYKIFRVLLAIGLATSPFMLFGNLSVAAITSGMTISKYFALAPLHMGFVLLIFAIDEILFAMLLYYLVHYDEKAVRQCIIIVAFPFVAYCIAQVTDTTLITYGLSSIFIFNFLFRCIYYIPNYFYFRHRLLPNGGVRSKPTPSPASPPVNVSAVPASSPKKQLTIDQVIARQKALPITQANPSPSAIEPPPRTDADINK